MININNLKPSSEKNNEQSGVFDKLYFEKHALLSICHMLHLKIKNFTNNDKPDLQSESLSIGIEVVQAITEHDGLTNSLTNKYFCKGKSGDEIVRLINENNKKSKFKGSAFSVDGTAVISSQKGLYDFEMHKNIIMQKIADKSQLYTNYKHYTVNGLYCFAYTGILNETDYPDIIKPCKKSPFSIIFINCIDIILQWNAATDKFIKHEISDESLKEWKLSAMKF